MDRALFISMSGAKQNMLGQTIHANNLANATTTGFKGDFEQARSMPVWGETYPTRAYAMTENPGTNQASGTLIQTGQDLDVAVRGDGWIAAQNGAGETVYTRTGNLRVDSDGALRNSEGLAIMGNGGPIVLPEFDKLDIAPDGTITIRGVGENPNALAEVDRILLVNPDKSRLEKGSDGFFRVKGEEGVAPDAAVTLEPGFLEGSNVNAVSEMISMLSLSKQFQVQVKMMSTAEENQKSVERLLQN
ncbi:flagellar basal body rod protein FlgF [Aestuariirhabdus litorea]|uniref:Flagellar basal-body rod protein FlgF n=1 Tax=Aestuariirhabdus litorea TaxID=2528527 RepID=A0A3P3VQW0_9GAMM|nr:flagellar basal body rod protein FlgF [Aestuariirhabdus litorea]RRJ85010.1 flagellar basal body rod protein FlgF [Aestuariirhabdus litorea]RWW98235.1 flagellar hook-basal body complex protein [Endozoicomonadaceae bacterium GTF-13]